MRQPWLGTRLCEWWRTEALRLRLAARWLMSTHPLLACQRYCDAILASLEANVAAAGQIYIETYLDHKWLPLKLKFAQVDELGLLRTALRTPSVVRDAARYQRCSEHTLDRFIKDDRTLLVQLSNGVGVRHFKTDGGTLLTEWNMRGIEAPIPLSDSHSIIWQGEPDSQPDRVLLELFQENLLWMGIARKS